MALLDSFLEDVGTQLAKWGEGFIGGGGDIWKSAGELVKDYITQDPSSIGGWRLVVNLYGTFQVIAISLAVVFFFVGWCRESIDIHRDFTFDNIIRFFIRFFLTVQSILLGLDLIKEFMALTAALTSEVATSILRLNTNGIFTDAMEELGTGGECLASGIVFFLGGLVGFAVILVCSFKIVMAVLSRFFRLFVTIPFAPVAVSTFAGGLGLSHTGSAWIKTFCGYCLEVLVIALALGISTKMFGDVHFFGGTLGGGMDTPVEAILEVCDAIAPIVACTSCISGAESVIRKCLGLNT